MLVLCFVLSLVHYSCWGMVLSRTFETVGPGVYLSKLHGARFFLLSVHHPCQSPPQVLGWAHDDSLKTLKRENNFSIRTLKEERLKEERSMRAWMERLIQVAAERGAFHAIRCLVFASDILRLGVKHEHKYGGKKN